MDSFIYPVLKWGTLYALKSWIECFPLFLNDTKFKFNDNLSVLRDPTNSEWNSKCFIKGIIKPEGTLFVVSLRVKTHFLCICCF